MILIQIVQEDYGSLKEINATNANIYNANNSPFKFKSSLFDNLAADGKQIVTVAVPLKYLSTFWRSLEMPLINYEVELSLSLIENWVLSGEENIYDNGVVSNAGIAATFKITDAKLYVPAVTLSTEDNAKLAKKLSEGFKIPIYWKKHKVIAK